MQARVTALEREGESIAAVVYEADGQSRRIPTLNVWSTLPISLLVRSMSPQAPRDVLAAATGISFRGMILIYLTLEQDRFSEYDAHYFPEESIPVSRLSEPENYHASSEPRGTTVLCAELPSGSGFSGWEMTDGDWATCCAGGSARQVCRSRPNSASDHAPAAPSLSRLRPRLRK